MKTNPKSNPARALQEQELLIDAGVDFTNRIQLLRPPREAFTDELPFVVFRARRRALTAGELFPRRIIIKAMPDIDLTEVVEPNLIAIPLPHFIVLPAGTVVQCMCPYSEASALEGINALRDIVVWRASAPGEGVAEFEAAMTHIKDGLEAQPLTPGVRPRGTFFKAEKRRRRSDKRYAI